VEPGTSHLMTLEPTVPRLRAQLTHWLRAHRL
jgi:hypothetical protein